MAACINHRNRMLVLLWITLLFAAGGITATKANLKRPEVKILSKHRGIALTCTAPCVCSEPAPNITWTVKVPGQNKSEPRGPSRGLTSTLTLNSSDIYQDMTVTCEVMFTNKTTTRKTVNVTYIKKPKIAGETTVKTGDALNLTCSVDSFPPSVVTWSKHGSNKSLNKDTDKSTLAELLIKNMKPEDFGRFICKATHFNNTVEEEVNVTVKPVFKGKPEILSGSGCKNHLDVVTCGCISKGTPLPTITWPLLKNHTDFIIITTTSSSTVNSTLTLAVNGTNYTSVECLSSNENATVRKSLMIYTEVRKADSLHMKILDFLTRLEIIIAFLIGALLSAIICCLARKCPRRKQKTYGDFAETLELVISPEDPLTNASGEGENPDNIKSEAAEGEDMAAGKSDVDYSNLDFSRMKGKRADAETTLENTETEYAEIHKAEVEVRQEGEGQDEEEVIEDVEDVRESVQDDKEAEDAGLYSNVKDIMGPCENEVENEEASVI